MRVPRVVLEENVLRAGGEGNLKAGVGLERDLAGVEHTRQRLRGEPLPHGADLFEERVDGGDRVHLCDGGALGGERGVPHEGAAPSTRSRLAHGRLVMHIHRHGGGAGGV